ncbi:MAG: hypothetical protein QOK37_4061 [Thermoanaerobaculia bacterium]|jgi:hypothetical protein|nr:hypothetical protein [Thermoanaerobaculia bacterium]
MKNDYLWDGSGDPEPSDADIRKLEELLGRYRSAAPMPDFRRVAVLQRRRWPMVAAAAAAIIAAVITSMFLLRPRASEWRITAIEGMPSIPDRSLRSGDVLRTDAASRIRIQSRSIGVIDVGRGSTVRLIESRKGRQRIALDVGVIHARTTSPPGVFVVDTPSARAIDLGCEYELSIAPGGRGELHVISGWVDLTRQWEQSLVPQGASAQVGPQGQISAPVFDDADPRFRVAVREFAQKHDLATILTLARKRDAFTLLNLFRLTTPDESTRLYDRLNELVPAPLPVRREAVRNWQPSATELWWRPVVAASGLREIKKKKGMLDGL